jgi:hypothetical protein
VLEKIVARDIFEPPTPAFQGSASGELGVTSESQNNPVSTNGVNSAMTQSVRILTLMVNTCEPNDCAELSLYQPRSHSSKLLERALVNGQSRATDAPRSALMPIAVTEHHDIARSTAQHRRIAYRRVLF